MSEDIRYGCYLRPSFAMSRAQAEIHDLLYRQYHLRGGGVFMPHATLKGFFRSDAPVEEMVTALDAHVASIVPFTVVNNGPIAYGNESVVINIHQDEHGARNESLQALHEAVWDALEPFVHPECDFTPREWARERFFAHLTLAMADVPAPLFDEIFAFIREAEPIGPRRFTADTVHLFAFRSEDWAGHWWETLEWDLLHSWRLRANARLAAAGVPG
jgi:2'-5' RNA ligase